MPSPRQLAEDTLRRYLADANDAIGFPVDPYDIASQMGISVFEGDLERGVSGVIIKDEDETAPRIYLNRTDSPVRKRFTLAHEIGHYLANEDRADFGYVDKRDELSARGEDGNEVNSNKFAAELLMPASVVRSWWAEGLSFNKIAKRFGVSQAALGHRLENLHLT